MLPRRNSTKTKTTKKVVTEVEEIQGNLPGNRSKQIEEIGKEEKKREER